MRKVILFALVGIALSIASYGVYETQSRKQTMSDILLANIEAISQSEIDPSCKLSGIGPFASVGTEKTEDQFFTHYQPGISLDILYTYSVERCIARGSGTLNGNPGAFVSCYLIKDEIVSCTNKCKINPTAIPCHP